MGVLIRCGIGLQGWGCDFCFLLCVLFAGWNGVVMLRWCSTNGIAAGMDWNAAGLGWRRSLGWNRRLEWRGFARGGFLGLCFVFLCR